MTKEYLAEYSFVSELIYVREQELCLDDDENNFHFGIRFDHEYSMHKPLVLTEEFPKVYDEA